MQRKILPPLLFSLLALTGCSCQQRLERLQSRCPDCFTQTTAHLRDTLPVPEKILSGSVPWAWLPSGDTVLLQNRDITLQLLAASAACTSTWPLPPHWWHSSPSGASPAKCAWPKLESQTKVL